MIPKIMAGITAGTITGLAAGPAPGAGFTTAAEVRPILSATRDNWAALRESRGKDLLYFTQLEAWRCGLSEIRYSVNDGPERHHRPEPCHTDSRNPNAMTDPDHQPYVVFPAGAVRKLRVTITYDDGQRDSMTYTRSDLLMR